MPSPVAMQGTQKWLVPDLDQSGIADGQRAIKPVESQIRLIAHSMRGSNLRGTGIAVVGNE